ncbi:HipA domain-containing protein [Cerasicoccus frondis]|uniref:HipA domain-containing protein n=1 Tax=Cerasicoccus frondis TaxID=490090 RepID=UPI0028529743|nr:HipA domain-containing protein [Cerasicoccus frondis]
MFPPFPVSEIQFESPDAFEQLGSKPKFWFRDMDNIRWLFKYARENTGEHWAEKVAEQIGSLLDIPVAEIELATCSDRRGTMSRSFADPSRGAVLIHGNELMAGVLEAYDLTKTYGQDQHNITNIVRTIRSRFPVRADGEAQLARFASYLVLDALIGNTDRHHENWGMLITKRAGGMIRELAPSYDHASSLGRELTDDARYQRLENGTIEQYILGKKAKGGIYWLDPKKAPPPLDLVKRAFSKESSPFKPILQRLREVEMRQIEEVVQRVPDAWISDTARQFSLELIRISRSHLLAL